MSEAISGNNSYITFPKFLENFRLEENKNKIIKLVGTIFLCLLIAGAAITAAFYPQYSLICGKIEIVSSSILVVSLVLELIIGSINYYYFSDEGNNCWMWSIANFIENIPELLALFSSEGEASSELKKVKTFFEELKRGTLKNETILKFRSLFGTKGGGIVLGSQNDVLEALEELFNAINIPQRLMVNYLFLKQQNAKREKLPCPNGGEEEDSYYKLIRENPDNEGFFYRYREPFPIVNIAIKETPETDDSVDSETAAGKYELPSFEKGFDGFFCKEKSGIINEKDSEGKEHSYNIAMEKFLYPEAVDNLFIHINRRCHSKDNKKGKITTELGISQKINLIPNVHIRAGEMQSYLLSTYIIHIGSDGDEGHWMTFQRKNNEEGDGYSYYKRNDNSKEEIKEEEFLKRARKAVFFHYSKIKS